MRFPFALTACLLAAPAAAQDTYDGDWVGTVTQVDSGTYTLVLSLDIGGGTSFYPELGCRGDLFETGRADGTVTFWERIVENRAGPGNPGGCIDGSFSVTGDGHRLGWSWIGAFEGEIYFAYAILDRKPAVSRPAPR